MEEIRKDTDKPKREWWVTMLIRSERYYCERFPVSAESAAHAISQVTEWLRQHTDTCEWEDFEFKSVEERYKKKR